MEKDKSIQVIRIVAMFSIILCHLMQEMDNGLLFKSAQFFNVGVYIFLFLSGLLYGRKNIDNCKQWFIRRFKTIMIPIYIFIIFLSIILLFQNNLNFKYILVYLLNVQYFFGGTIGAAHLWFATIIMICYLVTILLNKFKNFISKEYLILILIILSSFFSIFSLKCSLMLWYLIIYIIGYYFKDNGKSYILLPCVTFILSIICRILSQKYLDGTFVYDGILVPLFHIILAISIYLILKYLCSKFKQLLVKFSKLINHFDNMSYYIYITHYMFFVGPVCTLNITHNLLLNVLITLLLSYISALILKCIVYLLNILIKRIEGGIKDVE